MSAAEVQLQESQHKTDLMLAVQALGKSRLTVSRFVIAFVLFCVLNVCASIWFSYYKTQVIQEGYSLVEFARLKRPPQVVVLGSSVSFVPFWLLEKSEERQPPPLTKYTRIRWLEERLPDRKQNPVVFSLGFLGQLLSDDYFVIDDAIDGEHKPQLFVFMVTPRDCYDKSYPKPADGRAFRQADLGKFFRYQALFLPSLTDKVEFIVSRVFVLYASRGRLQVKWTELANRQIEHLLPRQVGGESHDSGWQCAVEQWRTRLADFTFDSADRQLDYLDRIGALCKERGLKTLMINMPRYDVGLLPVSFTNCFDRRTRDVCQKYELQYLDLSRSPAFEQSDFSDPVHLNVSGAEKFASIVLPVVKQDLPADSVQAK